ncbi:MAG: BREX-1 system adenine-specific DNA-methyltransferase PglX [Atopobiaceae bacterium]|nr:BREX-1 system adenine-specific DNA-methyltransferase PglX [Atopobiaceae bacterium]
MNDSAIKNYATWARRELISQVQRRCARYGILEQGSPDAKADAIDGRVLTAQEKSQRAKLLSLVAADGWQELVERAAYTWFNRLLAIRFMEVNDRLPSHVRVLSAADGTFAPQALHEAMDLPLDALDREEAARLVQAGDDEALFRLVFLAQCDELADCMPAVFSHIGGAMELLLPDSLLRAGGVVEQLVTAIPEDDWREGVEIVGWMYQYYVSERKDEVFAGFKKGKKAERGSIAPATQLFTPNWIVRYLTENSLGRLWVLNHLESELPQEMPYFVKPDEDHETGFRRVSSPEEITVVDPACGSGHILVYAFELLAKMYAEAGYAPRDAARLIVEKNLTGMEIDPRAAAMASFAVTMKACEVDSRFLRRGVSPRITVLERVELESEELDLCPNMLKRRELVDAAAHLDECGSLLRPTEDDLAAIEGDLASLAGGGTVFASGAREKLARLRAELEPLARRYDVVVANPPYMGSGNMNKWLGGWTKDNYAATCKDLCTCFIARGMNLAKESGYESLITSDTCMYISSFEKMRKEIINRTSIITFIDTRGTNAHPDVFDANAGWVLWNATADGIHGSYFKLNHPIVEKEARLLEALANPDCGWFYLVKSTAFNAIPGSPIAYWASSQQIRVFENPSAKRWGASSKGIITGKNDLFLRMWHEVSTRNIEFFATNAEDATVSERRWYPCRKGGSFRKWYGNHEYVIDWYKDGFHVLGLAEVEGRNCQGYLKEWEFKPSISWTSISSGAPAFRLGYNDLAESAGMFFIPDDVQHVRWLLGCFNSSVTTKLLEILAPTLNFTAGSIESLPIVSPNHSLECAIVETVNSCIDTAKLDWDSFEVSWGFEKHPLV